MKIESAILEFINRKREIAFYICLDFVWVGDTDLS